MTTAAPAGQTGTDFSALIPLDGLPPGTYAISLAVLTANGKAITQAVRIDIEERRFEACSPERKG